MILISFDSYYKPERLERSNEANDVLRGPTSRFSPQLARDATEIRNTDRANDLIYAERKFRDAVMQWVSDGKPKLLRSETEGNMIVMISGASFTPINSSRQIYSFSATVTEIAEYNLENLILYGLVPVDFEAFSLPGIEFGFIPGNKDTSLSK